LQKENDWQNFYFKYEGQIALTTAILTSALLFPLHFHVWLTICPKSPWRRRKGNNNLIINKCADKWLAIDIKLINGGVVATVAANVTADVVSTAAVVAEVIDVVAHVVTTVDINVTTVVVDAAVTVEVIRVVVCVYLLLLL